MDLNFAVEVFKIGVYLAVFAALVTRVLIPLLKPLAPVFRTIRDALHREPQPDAEHRPLSLAAIIDGIQKRFSKKPDDDA